MTLNLTPFLHQLAFTTSLFIPNLLTAHLVMGKISCDDIHLSNNVTDIE